jgi:HAD superfamily hydrolase (TIGR01490 family)
VIAALFDFDGTLYTGHIWQDLVRHHWRTGRHRRWVIAYLVRNLLPLPLYKLGAQSEEAYFHTWSRTMGWLLRGWSVEEADRLFVLLTREKILPNLRHDILGRLRQHQASGHLVALVSGTFAPWLERIAHDLDIGHAIGTQLEVRGGRYTGRVVPPVCQSEGKPERVRMYLAEEGLAVDWAASAAYADRDIDAPLLYQVGHPTAVYPDEALVARAQAEGWAVIGETTH